MPWKRWGPVCRPPSDEEVDLLLRVAVADLCQRSPAPATLAQRLRARIAAARRPPVVVADLPDRGRIRISMVPLLWHATVRPLAWNRITI